MAWLGDITPCPLMDEGPMGSGQQAEAPPQAGGAEVVDKTQEEMTILYVRFGS